ncbi:hypothetical protein [Allocoleopsis franciscana]|uniref:Uncharacterized protein n=1 Tax=Allocoleopsis franciscana PCC 7113 TaxID=1173027 RepID=K9WDC3_9CYAN|nr:hypothetical protein [Allocoleopsis franciscana]AFZ17522.1 hypothetical protein Mic7113_1653 [Allocoleopsis franciscana PCC 7113]
MGDITKGGRQKAEGKGLAGLGFSIWRESRVALAAAIAARCFVTL